MMLKLVVDALADLAGAFKRRNLAATLGWQDVRQRYRRSALGPFWLTISMGIMIGTIGIVFGQIFRSPIRQFLPFLSVGLILWGFISNVVTDGCTGFTSADAIIRQLPIPLSVHIFRLMWRNLIILAHNIVIFPLVLIAVGKPIGWNAFLAIPGLVLLIINLTWIALVLAVVCARYRDIPQIITSLLLVVFYLTPIMWLPSLMPGRAGTYLLNVNPVFHLIEIVRAPLLGDFPSGLNWIVSIAIGVVGWLLTLVVYGRYRRRVAYWL
jgi:ABC-type polysaccharide/polyol phosphate export permease